MPTPKFIVASGTDRVHLWGARADQLGVALFQGGARFSFDENVKVESPILVREGEWLGRNTDGKWRKAVSTAPSAYPVFLDPGAGRTDHEGGVSLIHAGVLTADTNMIGAEDEAWLVPQTELVAGALPTGHDFEGSIGLVPLAEASGGATDRWVCAIIQEVLGGGMYRISTCGYWSEPDNVPTTIPPTTTP